MRDPFIAIIDDDEVLCSSLVDLMQSVGYRAERFTSAESFLASPNLTIVDCVVTDVRMPGMSGLELVQTLRRRRDMIPAILITALTDRHLDDEARSVGAQFFLRKPFEAEALLDCIARSLSDRRRPR